MKSMKVNFYILYILLIGFTYFGISESKNMSEITSLKQELLKLNKQRETLRFKIGKDDISVSFNNSHENSNFAKLLVNFKYTNFIINLSRQYNQDPRLFMSMIYVESGFNSEATSPKNARGLMQITPALYTLDGLDPYNEIHNIFIGMSYFDYLYNTVFKNYNNVDRMMFSIAAYNCGPDSIRKIQSRMSWLSKETYSNISSQLPLETRNYVAAVIHYKDVIILE